MGYLNSSFAYLRIVAERKLYRHINRRGCALLELKKYTIWVIGNETRSHHHEAANPCPLTPPSPPPANEVDGFRSGPALLKTHLAMLELGCCPEPIQATTQKISATHHEQESPGFWAFSSATNLQRAGLSRPICPFNRSTGMPLSCPSCSPNPRALNTPSRKIFSIISLAGATLQAIADGKDVKSKLSRNSPFTGFAGAFLHALSREAASFTNANNSVQNTLSPSACQSCLNLARHR